MSAPTQPYVVQLPLSLARRVRQVLDDAGTGFESFSDLAVVALENQLTLIGSGPGDRGEHAGLPVNDVNHAMQTTEAAGIDALLAPLRSVPTSAPTVSPSDHGTELFYLTNRLAPVPFVLRCLLHETVQQRRPPSVDEFCRSARLQARAMALHLRTVDASHGATGFSRRATAWPAGPDESKSLERFAMSFLLDSGGTGGGRGPLVEMRLASVTADGTVLPTPLGLRLATAESPIIDRSDAGSQPSLSAIQQQVLRTVLIEMPAEIAAIRAFLGMVEKYHGMLSRVGIELKAINRDWTEGRVSAHRAAMVGRLLDAGVLTVNGRGQGATATLTPHAQPLLARMTSVDENTETIAEVGT